MPKAGQGFIWYVFVAIAIYLVLTNWRGANALLGTTWSGGGNFVKTLQGR